MMALLVGPESVGDSVRDHRRSARTVIDFLTLPLVPVDTDNKASWRNLSGLPASQAQANCIEIKSDPSTDASQGDWGAHIREQFLAQLLR